MAVSTLSLIFDKLLRIFFSILFFRSVGIFTYWYNNKM